MKIQPIKEPDAVSQWSSLLDLAFNAPLGRHYFDDFPVWDPRFNVRQVLRLGYFSDDGNELWGGVGARMAALKVPSGVLPVSLIGGVVTREDRRGKGIASELLNRAIQWSKEQGAKALVLWGEETELYRRQGFVLCGRQLIVPLSELPLTSAHPIKEVRSGWTPALFDLLKTRPEGIQLEESDRNWIEAHQNVQWYWTGPQEKPTAYVGYGRGIDLPGLVHEWGGDKVAVMGLLGAVIKLHPQASLLGSPWRIGNLFGQEAESLGQESPHALIKILDPAAVFKAFAPQTAFPDLTSSSLKGIPLEQYFFGLAGAAGESERLMFRIWFWGLDAA